MSAQLLSQNLKTEAIHRNCTFPTLHKQREYYALFFGEEKFFSSHMKISHLQVTPELQHICSPGTFIRPQRRLQCRAAKRDDKGQGGGINWDAEWKKARSREPHLRELIIVHISDVQADGMPSDMLRQ